MNCLTIISCLFLAGLTVPAHADTFVKHGETVFVITEGKKIRATGRNTHVHSLLMKSGTAYIHATNDGDTSRVWQFESIGRWKPLTGDNTSVRKAWVSDDGRLQMIAQNDGEQFRIWEWSGFGQNWKTDKQANPQGRQKEKILPASWSVRFFEVRKRGQFSGGWTEVYCQNNSNRSMVVTIGPAYGSVPLRRFSLRLSLRPGEEKLVGHGRASGYRIVECYYTSEVR
ncbi:hypothetical protein Pan189_25390 [Stratiformator vulcanicus]|uniref:Uncharacterized protein n=1 Tax=Stratiformator vulcanicus TaxID=2527980 RepID=A0A517R2P3_9PLAN|nr:hypothetical protein Pan189_25390 [Stratiformator vulcanicus]